MPFRFRGKTIQVLRRHEGVQGKARLELLGELNRSRPELTDALRARCTPSELDEVERWIARYSRLDVLRTHYAAATLPEQMALAAQWFKTAPPDEVAALVDDILHTWTKLRKALAVNR